MLLTHEGRSPSVHPTAYVAPNATLCGDVRVGAGCRVLFGAVLTAEGGPVELGEGCIVMENAVLRGTRRDPLVLGRQVLVGPTSYLTGCRVEDEVFLATGSRVFNGARIGTRAEVRINGIVHLRTALPADSMVPIGWVAVGDPARILPPSDHHGIWEVQKDLDFPGYVFGLDRPGEGQSLMPAIGAFDLSTTWQSLSADAPAGEEDPLYAPYRIYQPGRVGLIPWAFSQTEGEYHRLAGGEEPDKWPIVTRGRGYREWHQVDMSTPEFIYRVVADPQFEPFSIAALVPEPFFVPAPESTF